MQNYSEERHINVGSGEDITIVDLAMLVCEVVGFEGKIVTDESKPDGTPRKLLNTERLSGLGWTPTISSRKGIEETYNGTRRVCRRPRSLPKLDKRTYRAGSHSGRAQV